MVFWPEMNLQSTDGDKNCSELQRPDERCKRHGPGEDQMAHQPSGEKIRLQFVYCSEEGGKDWWRSRSESALFIFGRCYYPR